MIAARTRPLGPRPLAARAAQAGELAAELRPALEQGRIGRMLLLVPDPHSRFAAVELDGRFVAEEVLDGGYGICTYVVAWDVHRDPLPGLGDIDSLAPYLGEFGDLRMHPDLASAVQLPGEEGTWAVVCDVGWPDGAPVPIAPRTALRTQLTALERIGLVPSVGVEQEVVFLGGDGEPLTGHGLDYAIGGTEPLRPLLSEVRADLDRAGLEVESARGECHPGQYEIVLRHRDALAACDDAMLAQTLIRRASARHGAGASYLAAQATGQGSSCHVHLSLSTVEGEPLSTGEGTELPERLGAFLAGVLASARELTPLWAPTWNSYVRLRTAPFSPRELRWGVDDRTAAVRVAGRGRSLRLEFRFAGADAQPHLVVAALLAAGLEGITEGMRPPPRGEVVGELISNPLATLWELDRSRALGRLLGPEIAGQQAAILCSEIDAACDTVTDLQRIRGTLRA